MIDAIQLRYQLHAHPELSNYEIWTSDFSVKKLREMGISKIHTGFSQHSIVAEIEGQKADRTLLFHCELDALLVKFLSLTN